MSLFPNISVLLLEFGLTYIPHSNNSYSAPSCLGCLCGYRSFPLQSNWWVLRKDWVPVCRPPTDSLLKKKKPGPIKKVFLLTIRLTSKVRHYHPIIARLTHIQTCQITHSPPKASNMKTWSPTCGLHSIIQERGPSGSWGQRGSHA